MTREWTFTGRHMLLVVFGFFGTIIAVNVLMAYAAVSTFPGLNAHNSYVASQNYNLLLADAATQADRGYAGRVDLLQGRLALVLRDRSGAPLGGLVVEALAGRPASAATDRVLVLEPRGEGYEAATPLERGRWLVEIEARRRGELVWRQTQPVVVP
jgi:nitrogen fixation protein FixH